MIDRDLVPRFVSSSLIDEMKTGASGKELVIYKSLYIQNIRLNGKHPRFLTVSSMQVHGLKVVIGLCAMRALERCTV